MSEFYGLQNLASQPAAHGDEGSFGTPLRLANVGTGATAADVIYELPFITGPGTVRSFACVVCVKPTVVAPILKFWRRPIAGVSAENACVAMTPATMTIPLTSPTIIIGNVYRIFFTDGNEFAQGESFLVEADTIDSGAAATIFCGATGNVDAPGPGYFTSSGVTKATASSVGAVYTLTS